MSKTYIFRPGAVDALMRYHRLETDEQFAAMFGCATEDVTRLRAGAEVSPQDALRISTMRGDGNWSGGLFEAAPRHQAAA